MNQATIDGIMAEEVKKINAERKRRQTNLFDEEESTNTPEDPVDAAIASTVKAINSQPNRRGSH